jgi:hypothetical protein
MQDLSLHILDVVENSIKAEAGRVEIRIRHDRERDLFTLEIEDDGTGMDEETVKKALDPFFSTKTTRRFGLGLPLLAEAARATDGDFSIESRPGEGTKIRARFHASHIDMKPLGDMAQTLVTLIMGHPEVDIHFSHYINESAQYSLDTQEIKAELDGISIASPEVIRFIKDHINEGYQNLRRPT